MSTGDVAAKTSVDLAVGVPGMKKVVEMMSPLKPQKTHAMKHSI